MRDYYTITELTREFDITTRTLRFYEDEGLIQPVRRGRTRLFKPSDRVLLKQILRGRRLGFSVSEIRELMNIYDGTQASDEHLHISIKNLETRRSMLKQKKRDIDEALVELDHLEDLCLMRLADLGVGT